MRRRALRHLVGAQFLSETGDGIVTVALPLLVFARTGSATATSITFTAEMLAGVVLGIVGGVLADRFDRQKVLVWSFLARTALLLGAWAVGPLWLTVTLGVAARSLGQLDNPSFDALIPSQARDDLQQVLAVRRFIQSVSLIIGPAAGALLVWAVGETATIALASMTFAVAALIHVGIFGLDVEARTRRRAHHDSQLSDLLSGMAIVVRTRFVRRLCLYWAFENATIGLCMAAALVWFQRTLDAPDYWYGLSISCYGIGAASGLALFGGRRFTLPLPTVLVLSAPVYAVCCAVGVLAHVPWLMGLGWLVWGISLGPEIVLAEPAFVAAIDERMRGRAYAGIGVANTIGIAVGYAIAGPTIEWFGPRTVTLGTALAILVIGAMWLAPSHTLVTAAPEDQAMSSPTNSANTSA